MNVNRLSIIVGSFIIVVIVVLGWSLGISPKIAEAEATATQQQLVQTQNTATQAELVTLRAQFEQLDVLRANYAALQVAMPGSANGVDFVDQLERAARAADVTLANVTLGEPQLYVPSAGAAGAKPAAGTPATGTPTAGATGGAGASPSDGLVGKLYTVAVSVAVTGATENFYNFVAFMQEGSRMFMANSSTFSSLGTSPSGSLSGFILVVREPAAATAAAPAG